MESCPESRFCQTRMTGSQRSRLNTFRHTKIVTAVFMHLKYLCIARYTVVDTVFHGNYLILGSLP
jgi:hypothetical protein